MPSAVGDTRRARAWQLLRLAARSHRVSLVCAADGAVRLDQWRAVHGFTDHVILETPGAMRSWGNGSRRAAVHHTPTQWLWRQSFDTVMVTNPLLWDIAAAVDARLRVCDLDRPPASHENHRGDLAGALSGWSRRNRDHYHALMARRVAEEADIVTLSDPAYALLHSGARHKAVLLPHGIDADYFVPDERTPSHADHHRPQLVVHADWSQSTNRRRIEDMYRRVWPAIRRAVPDAQLTLTQPTAATPDALLALRRASVVVSPDPDPSHARWPILQAMAMRRAVVAPQEVARSLGVRHGEHLFAPSRDTEWADQCIHSLRDASVRLRLANSGRDFVERYCMLDRVGSELCSALLGGAATDRLRLAA
ncbi:MAG: hypothetical protein K8S99_01280 [Planctomycetes bacterium]|nr:hypothetical protein [Planctomycetota bacterium]